jgi:hypothetical protein
MKHERKEHGEHKKEHGHSKAEHHKKGNAKKHKAESKAHEKAEHKRDHKMKAKMSEMEHRMRSHAGTIGAAKKNPAKELKHSDKAFSRGALPSDTVDALVNNHRWAIKKSY